jgi:DNA-directed RNA polymerase specialized sigma24 family protein
MVVEAGEEPKHVFWPIASTRLIMSKNSSAIKAPIENPENWVDQYGDFLYRYALSRVRDPAIAEDLVQQTFLAALKARQNFKGRSTARTWMIAIHLLMCKYCNRFRKQLLIIRKAVRIEKPTQNDPCQTASLSEATRERIKMAVNAKRP